MKENLIILNVLPLREDQKNLFEAQAKGINTTFIYKQPSELDKSIIQRANIIIGNVPPKLIEASPNLMWLQLNSAGFDEYTAPGILSKDTKLTNSTGAYGLAISEHMLGMLLEIQKKLYLYRDNQKAALWKDEGQVTSIEGSKTLILGVGDIGSNFAKKMKALGSYTIGLKRTLSEKPDYLDEQHSFDALDSLLPQVDIIALSLPHSKDTVRLINKDRLLKMKASAILLNVGRGTVIDTDALYEVLESGHLLGAGLDVTDPEPLPSDHPLWSVNSIVITPHISGAYHLTETLNRIIQISTRNFGKFVNDETLENLRPF